MNVFNFKSILLLSGFVLANTLLMAQSSFTVDASQVYSTFKFVDSGGTEDKNYSGTFSGGYSIGYRHGGELGGLLIRASVGMRKAGATMVYDGANYMWDMQYLDVKAGAGYMLLGERLQPYLTVSPYFAYLLKANQLLNHENFDLLESGSLKSSDYGVFITPGIQMTLSDSFSAYVEFNYMMGLQNIETGSEQEAYNRAYALTLGVSYTISKK